jgi:hypothetical protein
MNKIIRISLPIIAVLILSATTGHAAGSHRGGNGSRGGGSFGRFFGGGGRSYGGHKRYGRGRGGYGRGRGWGLSGLENQYYYGYPYNPYYDNPYYDEVQPTNVYVEPTLQQTVLSQPMETTYWYYCRNPQGYYPYVKQCQDEWMKVVPSPIQEQ